jgi:hypothetical protein
LHGFLLFLGSDHFFPEYLASNGLADLEVWTGDKCAIFILQSPSGKWIDYTRQSGHLWWMLFGPEIRSVTGDNANTVVPRLTSPRFGLDSRVLSHTNLHIAGPDPVYGPLAEPVRGKLSQQLLEIDGVPSSLDDVFSPCKNLFQHSMEIGKVLHRFNLNPTQHPCLVLFRDIRDAKVWFIDLSDIVGQPITELRATLKDWFGGPAFREILEEARKCPV